MDPRDPHFKYYAEGNAAAYAGKPRSQNPYDPNAPPGAERLGGPASAWYEGHQDGIGGAFYPRGKLVDDGEVTINMGLHDDSFVLSFDKSVDWLGLDLQSLRGFHSAVGSYVDKLQALEASKNAEPTQLQPAIRGMTYAEAVELAKETSSQAGHVLNEHKVLYLPEALGFMLMTFMAGRSKTGKPTMDEMMEAEKEAGITRKADESAGIAVTLSRVIEEPNDG